jgi:hypothetical protein
LFFTIEKKAIPVEMPGAQSQKPSPIYAEGRLDIPLAEHIKTIDFKSRHMSNDARLDFLL